MKINSPNRRISAPETYARQITEAQGALYRYVCSLLGGSNGASDVLQETNLVLWSKADEFDCEREFLPWAFGIALYQVKAFRKRHACDRHVFGDAALQAISSRATAQLVVTNDQLDILEDCIGKLSERLQGLIQLRYMVGQTVRSIARQQDEPEGTIASALFDARSFLARCVQNKVKRGPRP